MKKFISVILSLAMLFTLSVYAFAVDIGTVYYVDSINGSDSNSGLSVDKAWKTLAKASEKIYSAGDKILLAAGGYFEGSFTANGSGSDEAPIMLSSYGDIDTLGKPAVVNPGTDVTVMLKNVSNWTVDNLDISAPDGKGIYIYTNNGIHKNITVQNCDIHDVFFKAHDVSRAGTVGAVYICGVGKDCRLENITVKDVNIRDCGYGIYARGTNIEYDYDIFESPEISYNQNYLYENVTMTNVLYDGIGGGGTNNLTVRNCALINTSLNTEFCTAPIWMHHTKNALIENCEVAGATNHLDGMTVDVDGWSTDCTFQYIYSHDNIVFMKNCIYDKTTSNRNCVVRYCLSVNDDQRINDSNLCRSEGFREKDTNISECMDNLRFYNNTIVNTLGFDFGLNTNSVVANNIFIGKSGKRYPIKTFTANFQSGQLGYIPKFTGIFANNCYVNVSAPLQEKNPVYSDPMFVGDDLTDKNSFMLSDKSSLIGKGITIPGEDMGSRDFYGNPINENTLHNIGCYEGSGISGGKAPTVFDKLADTAKQTFGNTASKLSAIYLLLKSVIDRTFDMFAGDLSSENYFSVVNDAFEMLLEAIVD